MTDQEKARLLAIRVALASRVHGLQAAEVSVQEAEEVAEWLLECDTELRSACLEEGLKHRTGGSRTLGLLAHAKALLVFVKAGPAGPPSGGAAKRSRKGEPREVRISG